METFRASLMPLLADADQSIRALEEKAKQVIPYIISAIIIALSCISCLLSLIN